MKIIDVAEFYAPEGGGVKTYINDKLAFAARKNLEMVIIAPGKQDMETAQGKGRIIWVKSPALPLDPRYRILIRQKTVHRILSRESPHVVEASSPWTGGWMVAHWQDSAFRTLIFHQDPVAVYPQTLLGQYLGNERVDRHFGWYWRYLKRLSQHFDATITGSRWLASRLGRFGIHNPQAVPFGIDKSIFSSHLRDPALRDKLLKRCGVSSRAKLLIAISRHHPEKRLGTLIQAIRRVSPRVEVGLMIYGDGPLRHWVERRARKVKGIYIAGFSSDRDFLARALASADGFLHGSSAETYGIAVAEAICSGLPLVVPDQGGAADLVSHEYAETYRAGDPEECANAIARLLSRDNSPLKTACLIAAQKRILTIEEHFDDLFQRYEEWTSNRL